MLPVWAVRPTEGWTAGSITAGVLLAGAAIALVVWAVIRASRQ